MTSYDEAQEAIKNLCANWYEDEKNNYEEFYEIDDDDADDITTTDLKQHNYTDLRIIIDWFKKDNKKDKQIEILRKKLDEGTEQHLADTKKLNKFYMKTKEENDKEKNTLKVEIAKLKEENKELMQLNTAHKEHKDLLKIQNEKLKEDITNHPDFAEIATDWYERHNWMVDVDEYKELKKENEELKRDTWTDEQVEEKIEEVFDEYELEDNYLSQEDEFNLESWLNDVSEHIQETDNEVDRLSELESIAWIDFYGEKEVIDNIKIYKFREDILKMKEENEKLKDVNELQHSISYFTKSFEFMDKDEFVEWMKDEYTKEKCDKFKKLLDYEEDDDEDDK